MLHCAQLFAIPVAFANVVLCKLFAMDCSIPASSVHRISQTRILKWIAIRFSRWSYRLRDWTRDCCIAGRFFTVGATREAQKLIAEISHFTGHFFQNYLENSRFLSVWIFWTWFSKITLINILYWGSLAFLWQFLHFFRSFLSFRKEKDLHCFYSLIPIVFKSKTQTIFFPPSKVGTVFQGI